LKIKDSGVEAANMWTDSVEQNASLQAEVPQLFMGSRKFSPVFTGESKKITAARAT
jgi:hypothetical protein